MVNALEVRFESKNNKKKKLPSFSKTQRSFTAFSAFRWLTKSAEGPVIYSVFDHDQGLKFRVRKAYKENHCKDTHTQPRSTHNDSLWHPFHTKEGDEISMFWGPCLQSSISTLSFSFFALFFCYAFSSCVYDHNHPYLVSERLFLAENKAFTYLRRALAHPRRALAILWDAAATWPVVIFVVVAAKQRSTQMSVACVQGPVDRLQYLSPPVRLNGHCRVIFQSIFNPKISLERSCPDLNERVLFLWIGRETAERRPFEVCRRIDFAIGRRRRPLYNSLTGYRKYKTNALLWRH